VQEKKAKKEYNQGMVPKRSIYISASTTRHFGHRPGHRLLQLVHFWTEETWTK
jgi:hypothetical protein